MIFVNKQTDKMNSRKFSFFFIFLNWYCCHYVIIWGKEKEEKNIYFLWSLWWQHKKKSLRLKMFSHSAKGKLKFMMGNCWNVLPSPYDVLCANNEIFHIDKLKYFTDFMILLCLCVITLIDGKYLMHCAYSEGIELNEWKLNYGSVAFIAMKNKHFWGERLEMCNKKGFFK